MCFIRRQAETIVRPNVVHTDYGEIECNTIRKDQREADDGQRQYDVSGSICEVHHRQGGGLPLEIAAWKLDSMKKRGR